MNGPVLLAPAAFGTVPIIPGSGHETMLFAVVGLAAIAFSFILGYLVATREGR